MNIDGNLVIETLKRQRNDAMDALAIVQAENAALRAEIQARPEGLDAQQTKTGER